MQITVLPPRQLCVYHKHGVFRASPSQTVANAQRSASICGPTMQLCVSTCAVWVTTCAALHVNSLVIHLHVNLLRVDVALA